MWEDVEKSKIVLKLLCTTASDSTSIYHVLCNISNQLSNFILLTIIKLVSLLYTEFWPVSVLSWSKLTVQHFRIYIFSGVVFNLLELYVTVKYYNLQCCHIPLGLVNKKINITVNSIPYHVFIVHFTVFFGSFNFSNQWHLLQE